MSPTPDPAEPVVEGKPGNEPEDLTGSALRLRIRQQELLAELGGLGSATHELRRPSQSRRAHDGRRLECRILQNLGVHCGRQAFACSRRRRLEQRCGWQRDSPIFGRMVVSGEFGGDWILRRPVGCVLITCGSSSTLVRSLRGQSLWLPKPDILAISASESFCRQNVSVILLRRGGRSGSNPQACAACSIIR
jgi:hypothetical protein